MKLHLSLAALLLATSACTQAPVESASSAPVAAAPAADPAAEDARLLAFVDAAFDEAIRLSPETMTSLGIKQDYGRLDDYTEAARVKSMALSETALARMKAEFDYDRLSPAGQLTYRLFESSVEDERRGWEWRKYGYLFSTNGSNAGEIPVFLINQHRVDSIADAEAYVSRLTEVERVMGEVAASARERAALGIVPPKMNFAPVRADAQSILKGAPFDAGADGAILADFRKKVEALDAPAEAKAKLVADATAAMTGPFKRGYDTFFAMLDELEPQAKGNDGAWALPRGEEYYAYRLRASTTTELTADQIHQTGLNEVARIHREMETIKARVGFTGTLQDFFAYVKNGQQFKYPNTQGGRDQYLADAKGFIAQVMAAAPAWFHALPKAPLEVRAVETWRQNTAPVAFYNQPTPDGSRPGIFYVNLSDMNQVLKPQIEGIAYHEGAPGHHFQIARQQELQGVPKFRRFGGYGAYMEGWGLYAEQLGKEMGFYQDPYSDFGRLSTELWRAVRLVTDTGLHSKRWSREQAIQYFRDNSMLSERDIVKEVERYINWPGQATSYKVGQLKILELRDKARVALGSKFDIKDFHEAVLADGALPLDVLEQQVDAYIAAKR